MNKQPRLSTSGFFRLAGFTIALAASNQALSYTVVIDDMTATQGSAGSPAVSQTGPGTTYATPFNNAGIYGGWRHIGLTNGASAPIGAYSASWVNPFGHDTGQGTWQVALPSGNPNGFGEIIWNGSSTLADNSLPPLNLDTLVQFTINYLYADHATTFYMQVYSAANECAQAPIATVNGVLTNEVVLKGDFNNAANACYAGSAPATLTSIKKIRIVFTGDQDALDTDLRGVSGTFEEPPQVQCVDKTLNGEKALQLPVGAKPPYNLTVGFTVSNTGGQQSLITVQDLMPAGMAPTGPVSCSTIPPGGITFGSQTTPDFTWNSTSPLAAGQTATCSFPATLSNINEGQTLTNLLQAGASGGPLNPNQCRATITRPGRVIKIPTMGEWGMITFMSLLGLLGVFGVRRYMA